MHTFVRASTPLGARALDARWYVSGAVYEAERDRVFGRRWICVGRLEQISRPGDFFTAEIAGESRSMNKSQGTGSPERKGTASNYFNQLAGDPATTDMFEGIDTTWSRFTGGAEVGTILQQAYDTFDPKDPSKSLPLLLQAHDLLQRLGASEAWNSRNNAWLHTKFTELMDVIKDCSGLAIDISAADSSVVPGGEVPVTVNVVNRSNYPWRLQMVAGVYAAPGKGENEPLNNNVPVKTDLTIKIPPYADISQPYWLQKPETKGAYTVMQQSLIGLPQNPPPITIIVTLADNAFHNLIFTEPAVYRWVDPVRGEETRSLDIVPDVTANLGSSVYVFPNTEPKLVTVWLQDFAAGATSAILRLTAPQGWKVDPPTVQANFTKKGDEAHATFKVTPTEKEMTGVIGAEVELPNGKKWQLGLTTIDYPHISPQRVFGDAAAKAVRVNVKKRGSRIGYIMGSGDDVAEGLRQIGYDVTLLTDTDLERGDFAKYDAIVTGVRAYNVRKRLKLVQPRLLDYVNNGGAVIVQYNKFEFNDAQYGPYPAKVSANRVTDENAAVVPTSTHSTLLTTPNEIGDAAWKNWVQERGTYFLAEDKDSRYHDVLQMEDNFPYNKGVKTGSLVEAQYGKGKWVYVGLGLWRQLPVGTDGAYQILANLISAGKR